MVLHMRTAVIVGLVCISSIVWAKDDSGKDKRHRSRPAASAARRLQQDVDALVKQGLEDMGQGQFDQALIEFEAAQGLIPDPTYVQHMAECHEALGHLKEAIDSYELYLKQAPQAPDAALIGKHLLELQATLHTENGRKLVEQKKYLEAEQEFEIAQKAKLDPKRWYEIASTQELLGEDVKAIESYRKYLLAVPNAPDAGEVEGRIAVLSGKRIIVPAGPQKARALKHNPVYTSKAGMATLILGLTFLAGGGTSVGLAQWYGSLADSSRTEAQWNTNVTNGKITQYVGLGGIGVGAVLLVTSIVLLYKHTRPYAEAAPPPVKEFKPMSWLPTSAPMSAMGGE